VSQFLLDFLRQSEPVIWLGLKELQVTAIVSLVVLVPLLMVIWRRTGGRTGQTPAALAKAAGSAVDPARVADPEQVPTS
jgi:hypothetical protein